MKYILPLLSFITISCTTSPLGGLDKVAKKRASFDFNCPEQYITVIPEGYDKFAVKGCGQKANYIVKCSLGPCTAERR